MPFKKGETPKGAKVFKKGQSGNPKGRPPDIKTVIAKVLSDEKDNISALEAILMAARNKAIKGDIKAAEFLINRAYGKQELNIDINNVPQTIINIIPDLPNATGETMP